MSKPVGPSPFVSHETSQQTKQPKKNSSESFFERLADKIDEAFMPCGDFCAKKLDLNSRDPQIQMKVMECMKACQEFQNRAHQDWRS